MKKNINEIVLNLLYKRGITGNRDITEFLSLKPLRTYDPFLMKGMREGVLLIVEAVKNNKKICIYGDYDADGVTSVSVLKSILDDISENVSYYIPGRFDEGYGLNIDAIKNIYEQGTQLLITVDCGITSAEEVSYAKKLGMDVIVTDHHNIGENIPDCIVIDPKQKDCPYPFDGLAGCGVAFKLAQGIQRQMGLSKNTINNLLDIVALGTIGDVVPLVDENRTIVKYGINRIRTNKRPGLEYLINKIGKGSQFMTAEDISFGIVPNLNAAGRMGNADMAVKFFTVSDTVKSKEIADSLLELNALRKEIQERDYQRCITVYEVEYSNCLFPLIVLEGAHEGVAGIVAGKMKDYCNKPVAILTEKDGTYKGTCRSTEDVDIHEILSKCQELFEKFGGHRGACGFTIKMENLNFLREAVEKEMTEIHCDMADKKDCEISFDMELSGGDVTDNLVEELELLEPFGAGNEKPVFAINKCRVVYMSYMGSDNIHMRFTVEATDGNRVACVMFNVPEEVTSKMDKGVLLNITGTFAFNRWNGRRDIQMTVKDISFC